MYFTKLILLTAGTLAARASAKNSTESLDPEKSGDLRTQCDGLSLLCCDALDKDDSIDENGTAGIFRNCHGIHTPYSKVATSHPQNALLTSIDKSLLSPILKKAVKGCQLAAILELRAGRLPPPLSASLLNRVDIRRIKKCLVHLNMIVYADKQPL